MDAIHVQPAAENVVRQIQVRGIIWAITGAVALLFIWSAFALVNRNTKDLPSGCKRDVCFITLVIAFGLSIISLLAGVMQGLIAYFAPLTAIFKM